MQRNLIFIGGAPGIGKTTLAKLLVDSYENSVWLDGDDLWKMNPFVVNDKTKSMVENNIKYVLNSFIQAEFSYIFFTWVLHLDSIVESLIMGLDLIGYNFKHFTLICNDMTLRQRLSSDHNKSRKFSLASVRLSQSKEISSVKIDTTGKSPKEIVETLQLNLIS